MEIWRTHRLHCIQYENKVISPTGLCSFSQAVKLWQNRVKHLKTFWNLLQWEDLNSSHIFSPPVVLLSAAAWRLQVEERGGGRGRGVRQEEEEEVRPGWLHSGFPWWMLTRKRKRGHFLEGLLKVAGQSGLWSWVWWELKKIFLF